MLHVEYGTCEQPKRRVYIERDFISLWCKYTALLKKSHSLVDDPRIHKHLIFIPIYNAQLSFPMHARVESSDASVHMPKFARAFVARK